MASSELGAAPLDEFSAGTCVSGPNTLCLNQERFRVDVQWRDFQGNSGAGQAVRLTGDTGYFWFFNSSNVELIVKVLDARAINGHFWVFYGALSNVEYTIAVTDTATGRIKSYSNPPQNFASVGDTQAFPEGAASSATLAAEAVADFGGLRALTPSAEEMTFALSAQEEVTTCVPDGTALCLSADRFRIEVAWRDFEGRTGRGQAVHLTSDTGYFWFFSSDNVELVVKVLDARAINGRFWVFYGALSNVEYEITVTDTSNGQARRYRNPAQRFGSAGDTQAFPPDQSPAIRLARELAERVSQARNDEERQQALLEILRALNVGVYTSSGGAVLRGAERGLGDFYLYDFEVQMMSQSLERRDTWGISDLTVFVNEMGILPSEVKLRPEDLREVLLDGTRSAVQDPDDRLSLAALLARELGLRQSTPYDAAVDMGIQSARFDALQYFLILADLTLPIVWEAGPVTVASRLAIESGGILRQRKLSPQNKNICEEYIAPVLKEEWSIGKAFRFLLKKVSIPARAAAVVIDAIHGPIVAFGVEVKALDSVLRTHYGHESPGKELQFRILVNMRDQLPEVLINCGWLAGVEFPRKGPIPGVTVVWLQDLKKHGELNCGGRVCTTSTGADGVATLIFKPKKEAQPGAGSQIEDNGLVEGVALYQSKLRNSLGTVAQILTPKSGATRWFVEYHEEGFELEFDSFIDGKAGLLATSRALAKVPLRFEEGKGYTGSAALSYRTDPKSGCDGVLFSGHGSTTLEVLSGHITPPGVPGGAPDIELTILPGVSMETQASAVTCTPPIQPQGPWVGPVTFWSMMFLASRGELPYAITGWTYVGTTEIYAQKVLTGNCAGVCNETTRLILRRRLGN